MTQVKLKKSDVGRFCRVVFNDVGAKDGIITKIDGPNDFRFLAFSNLQDGDQHNNGAPCVVLGYHITAENSGLDA